MITKTLPLSYYITEGFLVGRAVCRSKLKGCGYRWIAVCYPDVDPTKLKCPHCGNRNNYFIDIAK